MVRKQSNTSFTSSSGPATHPTAVYNFKNHPVFSQFLLFLKRSQTLASTAFGSISPIKIATVHHILIN
jgi:hypothetical protein